MIPLIGLLLCVYLIFKGVEIFQIACAVKDAPPLAIAIGLIAVFASIIIAAIFGFLFVTGASAPLPPQIPTT